MARWRRTYIIGDGRESTSATRKCPEIAQQLLRPPKRGQCHGEKESLDPVVKVSDLDEDDKRGGAYEIYAVALVAMTAQEDLCGNVAID